MVYYSYICSHKTIERMKNYEFSLYDKAKYFIDSTLIENCKDRDEALSRVKKINDVSRVKII